MEPITLVLATLIFGIGLVGGFALGAVCLYGYVFSKGVSDYAVRKKAYDKFVAELERALADREKK